MGLRINTNIASLNAQQNLDQGLERLSGNYQRLSSGLRITHAVGRRRGSRARPRSCARRSSRTARPAVTRRTASRSCKTAEGALGESQQPAEPHPRARDASGQRHAGHGGAHDDRQRSPGAGHRKSTASRRTTEFNGVQLLDGTVATARSKSASTPATRSTVTLQNATTATLAHRRHRDVDRRGRQRRDHRGRHRDRHGQHRARRLRRVAEPPPERVQQHPVGAREPERRREPHPRRRRRRGNGRPDAQLDPAASRDVGPAASERCSRRSRWPSSAETADPQPVSEEVAVVDVVPGLVAAAAQAAAVDVVAAGGLALDLRRMEPAPVLVVGEVGPLGAE